MTSNGWDKTMIMILTHLITNTIQFLIMNLFDEVRIIRKKLLKEEVSMADIKYSKTWLKTVANQMAYSYVYHHLHHNFQVADHRWYEILLEQSP